MYHDDRATLGWGTPIENKFGTPIASADLADSRATTPQARRALLMDKGNLRGAVDIALDRVENLEWVGLTHRYEESVCALAFALRKTPVDSRRPGGMLGAFKATRTLARRCERRAEERALRVAWTRCS